MAESSTGSRSHIFGIIRLVAFIILVAVAVFFLVVFIKNRRSDKAAVDLTQVSQNKDQKESSSSSETTNNDETKADDTKSGDSPDATSQDIKIPSGVEDVGPDTSSMPGSGDGSANQPNANKSANDSKDGSIPEAGMGSRSIYYAVLLSGATYLLVSAKARLATHKK